MSIKLPDLRSLGNPIVKAGTAGTITAAFLACVTFWESGGKTITTPYRDAVGVLTVCDGITNMALPGFVVEGKKYTVAECQAAQVKIIHREVDPYIVKYVKHDLTNVQYEMLVDFIWGVGPQPFINSTMLKYVNSGECLKAGDEFNKFVRAGKSILPGLVKRAAWHDNEWSADCTNPIWGK